MPRSRCFYSGFLAAVVVTGFCGATVLRAQDKSVQEFYVSPIGADTNPGTEQQPFLTLDHARDSVRLINRQMKGDIVVYLRSGTYALTNTLTFTPEDSGNNGHSISYQAYASEMPFISGGKAITGWSLHDKTKNIWQAKVAVTDNFRQIYVNGLKAIRACSSGTVPLRVTTNGYRTTDLALQHFGNISNMEVVVTPRPWQQERIPLATIQGSNVTIQEPCWDSVKTNKEFDYAKPTRIENAYEFMSNPGDWYLDRKTHTLYYIPRAGENMATARVEVPVVEQIIAISGNATNAVSHLRFAGLTLRLSNWVAPSTSHGMISIQANQGTDMPAALDCTGAHDVVVTTCTFKQLGGDAINLLTASQDDVVGDCDFHEIAGSAFQIGGLDQYLPSGSGDIVSGIVVTNCTIHNVCADYQGGCAIFVGWTADCTIAHNEIYNVPYTAISLGWGWTGEVADYAGGNRILDNKLHDHLQVLADGGGIYCNGYQQNGRISGNYIYNQGHVFGEIYLDSGAANWTVVSNVCKKTSAYSWYLYKGSNNHAEHNFTDNDLIYEKTTGPLPSTLTNTTVITNGDWPPAALAIMNAAGTVARERR